jgi:hypothetical protein
MPQAVDRDADAARLGHPTRAHASETAYVARTRDRRRLQFSISGEPDIERAYRTYWVSPDLKACAP